MFLSGLSSAEPALPDIGAHLGDKVHLLGNQGSGTVVAIINDEIYRPIAGDLNCMFQVESHSSFHDESISHKSNRPKIKPKQVKSKQSSVPSRCTDVYEDWMACSSCWTLLSFQSTGNGVPNR